MIKLTIPKAILIGSFTIALVIFFSADNELSLVTEAKADVAGMGYLDLRRDRDFKKAVKYIVENCSVSGYVDIDVDVDIDLDLDVEDVDVDGYLYSSRISC